MQSSVGDGFESCLWQEHGYCAVRSVSTGRELLPTWLHSHNKRAEGDPPHKSCHPSFSFAFCILSYKLNVTEHNPDGVRKFYNQVASQM
jgi:hypothetical protein